MKTGDHVMVQFGSVWEPASVIRVDINRPRSFVVKLNKNGRIYLRNRRFLKKIFSNFCSGTSDTECDLSCNDNENQNIENEEVNVNNDILENENEPGGTPISETPIGETPLGETPNAEEGGSIYRTRFGRITRKPCHLQDYI